MQTLLLYLGIAFIFTSNATLLSTSDTFELQLKIGNGLDLWCLTEDIHGSWKSQIAVRKCDGSFAQQWTLDANGFLKNYGHLDLCLVQRNKFIKCDAKTNLSSYVYSSDGTIRLHRNPLFALRVKRKQMRNIFNRDKLPVSVKKIFNRSPRDNEVWTMTKTLESSMPSVHQSLSPSLSPIYIPSCATYSPSNIADNHPSTHPVSSRSDEPNQVPSISPSSSPSSIPTETNSPTHDRSRNFHISLMNMGNDTTFDTVFRKAATRWEEIIVEKLSKHEKVDSNDFDLFDGTFQNAVNVEVDDVLIGYSIENIDGLGDVLGYAGPVFVRQVFDNSGNVMGMSTISGIMKFDINDFQSFDKTDVELVILHEIGHVLGIGSLFGFMCGTECSEGNTTYTCSEAANEYKIIKNSTSLEIDGESCGHWDEDAFLHGNASELMTPYFEEGIYQPISSVSVAALADFGYKVDLNAADPWIPEGSRNLLESEHTRTVLKPHRTFSTENISHTRAKVIGSKMK